MAFRYQLGFIGAGNMAEGIAGGILRQKLFAPNQILAADPAEPRRALFADQFGIEVTDDNLAVAQSAQTLILSIKPQTFAAAAAPLHNAIRPDHRFISIMAGLSCDRIAAGLGHPGASIIRVMPNLPIRVGAGVAGLFAGRHAGPGDLTLARSIFDAGGGTIVVEDEALMDAVTAVSGSGPAYFYYFVEAIAAAGQAAGLPYEDALHLAEHTCLGAAKMMLETGEPPAELRRKVTSPGGTTQAAIESMKSAGVADLIRSAVLAADRRSKELGM
jgi:pyrroline-5-carboxylate reductase